MVVVVVGIVIVVHSSVPHFPIADQFVRSFVRSYVGPRQGCQLVPRLTDVTVIIPYSLPDNIDTAPAPPPSSSPSAPPPPSRLSHTCVSWYQTVYFGGIGFLSAISFKCQPDTVFLSLSTRILIHTPYHINLSTALHIYTRIASVPSNIRLLDISYGALGIQTQQLKRSQFLVASRSSHYIVSTTTSFRPFQPDPIATFAVPDFQLFSADTFTSTSPDRPAA